MAADQPGPADWTGFRYVQQTELRTYGGYTLERTEEIWTDSDWQGRRASPEAKVVAGTIPPAHPPGQAARRDREEDQGGQGRTSSRAEEMKRRARGDGALQPDPKSVLARPRHPRLPGACPTSTATARWPRSR